MFWYGVSEDLTVTLTRVLNPLGYERNVNRGLEKHFIVNGRELARTLHVKRSRQQLVIAARPQLRPTAK